MRLEAVVEDRPLWGESAEHGQMERPVGLQGVLVERLDVGCLHVAVPVGDADLAGSRIQIRGIDPTERGDQGAVSHILAEVDLVGTVGAGLEEHHSDLLELDLKLTVVLRKAYGGAVTTMNSKGLGADIVFAWLQAEIGIMNAAQAVGIIDRHAIEAAPGPMAAQSELDLRRSAPDRRWMASSTR